MSLFVRSSIYQYHTIPIQNPYLMGGMDMFANPQTRIFSPLTIFDLLLIPPYSNLMALITLAIIGSFGFYKLIVHLKLNKNIALIGSILFIHSSWFSLHFSEGHIIFGSFQLIGLAFYFILRLHEKKYKIYYALLNAFYLLDGGFYAFIFTNLLLLASLAVNVNESGSLNVIKSIYKQWKTVLLSLVLFITLASTKLVPFLWMHHGRKPIMEFVTLKLKYLLYCIFDPFQYIVKEINGLNIPFHFHEIGFYFGILSFVLLSIYLSFSFNKLYIKYILIAIFFLWIGAGWFSTVNPWLLFQKIPLLNNAHVQSRLFLISYLMLIILLCYSLNYYHSSLNKFLFYTIITILISESIFVSSYSYYKIFKLEDSICKTELFRNLIKSNTINKTIKNPSNDWGFDFMIYLNENTAAKNATDPSFKQGNIKTIEDTDYKGEIYITKGKGMIKINSYTPGSINLSYNLDTISEIQLNTNYLLGWRTDNNNVKSTYENSGLLTFQPDNLTGTVMLTYRPVYLYIIFPLFSTGLILAFMIFVKKLYL
jgi:hypothetical protein